jgi:hypothetical protein
MPEYVRVAAFDADSAAVDAMVATINAEPGPPPDVPAKRIAVLADRDAGKALVVVRFGSKEDLERGSAVLDAMAPPEGTNMHRTSVEKWEVVLEREA